MARSLTCPVCGYKPIIPPMTERQELEYLRHLSISKGDNTEITKDASELDEDKQILGWIFINCPNSSSKYGIHKFRFNQITGEVLK